MPFQVQTRQIQHQAFSGVAGIKDVRVEGNILRCTVVGTLDSFIKKLAKFEVINILSQEPNLEEVFLNFYEGKEKS